MRCARSLPASRRLVMQRSTFRGLLFVAGTSRLKSTQQISNFTGRCRWSCLKRAARYPVLGLTLWRNKYANKQETDQLCQQVDEYFNSQQHVKALALLKTYDCCGNIHLSWRLARTYVFVAKCLRGGMSDRERRKLFHSALEHATDALSNKSEAQNQPNVHKWFAISLFHASDCESQTSAERARNRSLVAEHLNLALEMRPDDADCWHYLGRHHYRWMQETSPFERPRRGGGLHSDQLLRESALRAFARAEHLHREYSAENYMYIGRILLELDVQLEDARRFLLLGLEFHENNYYDRRAKVEIEQLLGRVNRRIKGVQVCMNVMRTTREQCM